VPLQCLWRDSVTLISTLLLTYLLSLSLHFDNFWQTASAHFSKVCWCCLPKIIKICPMLLKLQLAKVGTFFETQCSLYLIMQLDLWPLILPCVVYCAGHLIAPVIAHVFCNHMGFPNFSEIFAHKSPARYYVAASFAAGLVLWFLLLFPLTEPAVFSNDLYYQFWYLFLIFTCIFDLIKIRRWQKWSPIIVLKITTIIITSLKRFIWLKVNY